MSKQSRTVEQRLESLEEQIGLLQKFVIDLDNADEKNYDMLFKLIRGIYK